MNTRVRCKAKKANADALGRATVSLLRNNTGRELDDVMLFAAVCVHGQQVHVARVEEQPASGYHANRDHVRIGRMEVS